MRSVEGAKFNIVSTVGYALWFLILVRLLYVASGSKAAGSAEMLGMHVGFGLTLLVVLAAAFIVGRVIQRTRGQGVLFFSVMTWTTIIALVLAAGGMYGRLSVANQVVSAQSDIPSYGTSGWTQEETGSAEPGPWLEYSPPGTRYCRYRSNEIVRLYPPGLKPEAGPANVFCLGNSFDRVPPRT